MATYSRDYKEERVATAKLLGAPWTAAVWNIEPGVLYDWVRKGNMYGAYGRLQDVGNYQSVGINP